MFATFVLALACVLGVAIARTLLQREMTAADYGQLMAAWRAVVVILFAAGILWAAAAAQGGALLLTASSVATRHERAAERQLLGNNMSGASDPEADASGEVPDPGEALCGGERARNQRWTRTRVRPPVAGSRRTTTF